MLKADAAYLTGLRSSNQTQLPSTSQMPTPEHGVAAVAELQDQLRAALDSRFSASATPERLNDVVGQEPSRSACAASIMLIAAVPTSIQTLVSRSTCTCST
jgi:hypothetical protein